MVERSRFWNSTVTGDATEAPYDAPTEFAQVLMGIGEHAGLTDRGRVIRSTAAPGTLQPTSPGANTLRIATGEALVYGSWYQNDANIDVTIPTPGGATRIDRVVLRKSWSAQNVRVTRIAGTEGGGAPALVQTVGTTWDFPLAQVSITTGGVMTITDQRKGITRNFFIPLQNKNDGTGPVNDGTYGATVFKLADTGDTFADGVAPSPEGFIPTVPLTFRMRMWAETATSGNVRVKSSGMFITTGQVANLDNLDGIPASNVAVPGTADHVFEVSAVHAGGPVLALGDWVQARVLREGSDAGDTATGDINVLAMIEVEYEAYE